MKKYHTPPELHGQRIDTVLLELMKAYSRSFVQKLIRKELVRINGKIAKKGNRVESGDEILVKDAILIESHLKPREIPLDILYEDEDLLVVHKPAGLLTHPTGKEREQSLVNALLFHCGTRLSGIGGERRPGIVHRLDKDTSGILVVAKHDEAHIDLAKQFQKRIVEKTYLALVKGILRVKTGTIESPLTKTRISGNHKVVVSPGKLAKHSITHFTVEKTYGEIASLLSIRLVTGRMHQIRVHLSAIGHPVIGDHLYGNEKINTAFAALGLHRQFLHAQKLSFVHPRTHQKMSFEAPLPEDLHSTLRAVQRSMDTLPS